MSKFRLLSKREIDVAKAKDRQKEIDEGMKLAKRVDGLREVSAREETNLEELRHKLLTEIQITIDPKIRQLESLKTEINELTLKRDALQSAEDNRENDLNDKEEILRQVKEDIAKEKAELKLAIAANIQRERGNEIESQRIIEGKQYIANLLLDAEGKKKSAETLFARAKIQSDIDDTAREAFEKEMKERYLRAAAWEANLEVRTQKNAEREVDLGNRETFLKDRYATLENTIKRYGSKR